MRRPLGLGHLRRVCDTLERLLGLGGGLLALARLLVLCGVPKETAAHDVAEGGGLGVEEVAVSVVRVVPRRIRLARLAHRLVEQLALRRRRGRELAAVEVRVLAQQVVEGDLAPHVGHVLQAELGELHAFGAHRVDNEPRRDGLQVCLLGALGRVGDLAGAVRELAVDQAVNLGRHEQVDRLALGDATHAEGTLGVITEDHVLTERECGAGRETVRNIHTGGVDLVVEGETFVERDTALLQLEHAARGAHEDHLAVELIKEDDTVGPLKAGVEQELRDLEVGHARDERARVDERVERRLAIAGTRRGDVREQRLDGPALGDRCHVDVVGRREHADHLAVGTLLVAAAAELERDKVRGRAGETDTAREEHVTTNLDTGRG